MSRPRTPAALRAGRIACALLAASLAATACSREEKPSAPAAQPPAAAPAPQPAPAPAPSPTATPEASPPPAAQSMAPPAAKPQDAAVLAEALNNLRSPDPEVRADAVLDIEPEGVGLRTLVDTLGDPDKAQQSRRLLLELRNKDPRKLNAYLSDPHIDASKWQGFRAANK
jgi:predicted component of type VI protein secretion system